MDRDSGAGIVLAPDAVAATGAAGTAFLQIESIDVADNPGNGNGVAEVGEGARVVITLKNYGVAPATNVAATLTTSSVGSDDRAAEHASSTGRSRLQLSQTRMSLFTTAPDFGCPATRRLLPERNLRRGARPVHRAVLGPDRDHNVRDHQNARRYDAVVVPERRRIDGDAELPPESPSAGEHLRRAEADAADRAGGPQVRAATIPTHSRRAAYSTPACVSVTFGGPNSVNMFSAAYVPTFDPNNIPQNYKADPAVSSGGALTYSFDSPAGSSNFAVNVNDVVPNAPTNSEYTLTVQNACLGTCEPPNHPPAQRHRR